jgi:cytochrome c-type biogenesis protein CcmH/NrfG
VFFYLSQATAQAGYAATARAHWQRLLAQVPADTPARARIQRLIDLERSCIRPVGAVG